MKTSVWILPVLCGLVLVALQLVRERVNHKQRPPKSLLEKAGTALVGALCDAMLVVFTVTVALSILAATGFSVFDARVWQSVAEAIRAKTRPIAIGIAVALLIVTLVAARTRWRPSRRFLTNARTWANRTIGRATVASATALAIIGALGASGHQVGGVLADTFVPGRHIDQPSTPGVQTAEPRRTPAKVSSPTPSGSASPSERDASLRLAQQFIASLSQSADLAVTSAHIVKLETLYHIAPSTRLNPRHSLLLIESKSEFARIASENPKFAKFVQDHSLRTRASRPESMIDHRFGAQTADVLTVLFELFVPEGNHFSTTLGRQVSEDSLQSIVEKHGASVREVRVALHHYLTQSVVSYVRRLGYAVGERVAKEAEGVSTSEEDRAEIRATLAAERPRPVQPAKATLAKLMLPAKPTLRAKRTATLNAELLSKMLKEYGISNADPSYVDKMLRQFEGQRPIPVLTEREIANILDDIKRSGKPMTIETFMEKLTEFAKEPR